MRAVLVVLLVGCTSSGIDAEPDDSSVDGDLAEASGETGRLEGITDAHNVVRGALGLNDLVWDDELSVIAAEWIAFLSDDGCYLEHDWSSPYGENLYWSSYNSESVEVVQSWASEVQFYDYDSNTCAPNQMCGHYTQIVWADTKRVGCELITCADSSEIWMCVYDPAGNWQGEWPY